MPGYPALFKYEKLNMMKNLISKTVGGKMKAKEPVGDSAEVPDSIKSQLAELNSDLLQVRTQDITHFSHKMWTHVNGPGLIKWVSSCAAPGSRSVVLFQSRSSCRRWHST